MKQRAATARDQSVRARVADLLKELRRKNVSTLTLTLILVS